MNNLIWIIDSFMDTPVKAQYTRELIEKIKIYGEDIAVISHTPIPEDIQKSVNYSIYDCRNTLIEDWSTTLWYGNNNLKLEYLSGTPYQGYSIYLNRKNAISLLKSKYKRGIFIEYDFDLTGLDEFREKTKDILFDYDLIGRWYKDTGINRGILTDIYSVNLPMADEVFPEVETWENFKKLEISLLFENLVYNCFLNNNGLIKIIEMKGITNRVYSDGDIHVILCDETNGGVLAFFFNRSIIVRDFKINDVIYTLASKNIKWFYFKKDSGAILSADNKEYTISPTENYKGKFWFLNKQYISSYWGDNENKKYLR